MKCLLRLRMWSCLCFCPCCKPRLRQQCIVQLTSDQSSNIPYLFHLLSHCNRQPTCWLLSENYVNLQPHLTSYFTFLLLKNMRLFHFSGVLQLILSPKGTCSQGYSTTNHKLGLREQHKHKDKIDTKTKHDISSETWEDKTTRIFLCLV